jgi:uncharacterized protein (TIGR00288 family)
LAEYSDEQRIALFIDYENIAIGVRDARYRKFDVHLVLERLLDKGKLLVKKAYADWSRYSDAKRSFHEAAIELIEVPQKSVGGKNSADIRMVVDAMDMSFQKEHINCFVVASGDSDFSPLVSKLKENNKYVIGVGVKNSTSDLLMENCDEFIFYEDLVRGKERPLPQIANVPEKVQECFALLVESVLALQRENKEILWGSMVKETMKRKKPSFNETYYGFRTFSHLLEDAQRRGIVKLRRDQRSGSYVIEDLGAGQGLVATVPPPAASAAPAAASGAGEASGEGEANGAGGRPAGRRRRGRGRRGRGSGAGAGDTAERDDTERDDAERDDAERDDASDDSDDEGYVEGPPEPGRGDWTDGAGDAASEPSRDPSAGAEATKPGDRPSFSLFSWLRGDEERPEPGPGSEGDKDK